MCYWVLPFEAILLLEKLASNVNMSIMGCVSQVELSLILVNLSLGTMIHLHTSAGMGLES